MAGRSNWYVMIIQGWEEVSKLQENVKYSGSSLEAMRLGGI